MRETNITDICMLYNCWSIGAIVFWKCMTGTISFTDYLMVQFWLFNHTTFSPNDNVCIGISAKVIVTVNWQGGLFRRLAMMGFPWNGWFKICCLFLVTLWEAYTEEIILFLDYAWANYNNLIYLWLRLV